MTKPLCIDLFCGLGGWAEGFIAEGYRVLGFDIEPRFAHTYPGEFVLADVRTLDGKRFHNARCIVASPPCTEFSTVRWVFNPELRKSPNKELWRAVQKIAHESGQPCIIENVQGAQRWMGKAKAHFGPFYLWGDVPPLVPQSTMKKGWYGNKGNRGIYDAASRSKIPFYLARAMARAFK